MEINIQNIKREKGENIHPLKKWFDLEIENKNKNITDNTKPITPPNLFGIERRIA